MIIVILLQTSKVLDHSAFRQWICQRTQLIQSYQVVLTLTRVEPCVNWTSSIYIIISRKMWSCEPLDPSQLSTCRNIKHNGKKKNHKNIRIASNKFYFRNLRMIKNVDSWGRNDKSVKPENWLPPKAIGHPQINKQARCKQ